MGRLYVYGKLNRIASIPGISALPGTYTVAHGVQYGEGAFDADATYNLEFGEPVEIASENQKAVGVKRATSSLTAATLAFVVRDIVGVRSITSGVAEAPASNVPLTIVKASAPHSFAICVPLAASVTAAAGGSVYIGLGSGSTVAGAVYAAAQGGGSNSIDSGWKFLTAKFAPTSDTTYYCAWISK